MIEVEITEERKEAWELLGKMIKAFDLLRVVSLPPNDCSGMRMWDQALAARKEVGDRLGLLVEKRLAQIREVCDSRGTVVSRPRDPHRPQTPTKEGTHGL